jgi:hypothetical protein
MLHAGVLTRHIHSSSGNGASSSPGIRAKVRLSLLQPDTLLSHRLFHYHAFLIHDDLTFRYQTCLPVPSPNPQGLLHLLMQMENQWLSFRDTHHLTGVKPMLFDLDIKVIQIRQIIQPARDLRTRCGVQG